MPIPDDAALQPLQERLGMQFKDRALLWRALTHRSAAADGSCVSNERLEFLGDSIIGLVISEYLYRKFPEHSEGELAKSKSYIVSENSLAAAAQEIGLQDYVLMSTSEAASGGRRRRSILSDAFEAVIGAAYLDSGIVVTRRLVKTLLKRPMDEAQADTHRGDYKSSLQERTQALYRQAPVYQVVAEEGQEHDKTFAVQAVLRDEIIGAGNGKTKKEAEQSAARSALLHLMAGKEAAP